MTAAETVGVTLLLMYFVFAIVCTVKGRKNDTPEATYKLYKTAYEREEAYIRRLDERISELECRLIAARKERDFAKMQYEMHKAFMQPDDVVEYDTEEFELSEIIEEIAEKEV